MDPGSTEIVVHAVRAEKISSGKTYECGELYRVNLDTRKISKCPGGQLNFDNGFTSMAISGDFIYIIGGNLYSKKHLRKYFKDKQHLHSRTSYINLVNHDSGWNPLPDFRIRYPIVSCVTFKGKLFVFGGASVSNTTITESPSHGEELCFTSSGTPDVWHFLPSPPSPPSETNVIYRHGSNNVTTPALVDSKNNRILVHYARISSLYAYYPDERKWDFLFCIEWHHLVAVFDDRILFHYPGYFRAYDLQTGIQLDHPFVSTKFPSKLLHREFDTLIPLAASGTFCLAAYSMEFDVPDITHLIFAKFRVVRNPSGNPRIIFISSHKLDLDCKVCVTNYVPIDVVVSSKKDNVVVSSKKDNVVDSSKRDNVVKSKLGNVVVSSQIGSWDSAAGIPFGTIRV